jgi:hypothetical protein
MQKNRGMAHAFGASRLIWAALAFAPVGLLACPSAGVDGVLSDGGVQADGVAVGGPVFGPVDNHCYILPDGGFPGGPLNVQVVDWDACPLTDGGPQTGPEYGATNYNTGANDDDCKYNVAWWSTPIQFNPEVWFYVSGSYTADGTPLTVDPRTGDAVTPNVIVEIEDDSGNGLPPPNAGSAVATEIQPGVFEVGPFLMNTQSHLHGTWQVRFHFNENCVDSWDSSPHGHTAFYFTVP